MSDFESILKKFSEELPIENFANGKVGIEKENLRVLKNNLSKEPHPKTIGSSLCNKYITTDFSESQLELITPPYSEKNETIRLLDNIHHFTFRNIGNESLWPMSMPPLISQENEIPIADYGQSNLGLFKKIYRRGLSHRYGLFMQVISGVHYNYSLPDQIWPVLTNKSNITDFRDLKSKEYLKLLRNAFRMNWLILYLFGASPAVTKNFLTDVSSNFTRFDDLTYYSTYATSLRMSDIGYQNFKRQRIKVSTDSLVSYISDLRQATETHSKEFQKLSVSDSMQQINTNIIQIEDEYYAVARIKSGSEDNIRFTSKLEKTGVDYLELRSLDLDPFSRTGISRETILFLEIFLIYCFLKPSKSISIKEEKIIRMNDSSVAYHGRKPGLKLIKEDKEITLKNWANEIILEIEVIADMLFKNNSDYIEVIKRIKNKIEDPNLTISGLIMNEMHDDKINYLEMGEHISKSNKEYYEGIKRAKNKHWAILNEEAESSLRRQFDLEKRKEHSYERFLKLYFQK